MGLRLNTGYISSFISDGELLSVKSEAFAARDKLFSDGDVPGAAFRGWVDLPVDHDREEFAAIKTAAARIRGQSSVLVVVGIGGSYLGARAVIEFLKTRNFNLLPGNGLKILFLGNSLDPEELSRIADICRETDFSVNVISKSGTTTEPAIAFRVLKSLLEQKYGDGANERIYVTTDRKKGTLKREADERGWSSFVVPDAVGGRYSVLTAVGLLPIAAAGVDIDELMTGAAEQRAASLGCGYEDDPSVLYAAIRNLCYRKGKRIELFASYETDFTMMNEWLKQLFGESEGKDGKGLFPASVIYTTDLHSMGQYVQQGERLMFETVISFKKCVRDVVIDEVDGDPDGLNYLAGKSMSFVNGRAFEATVLAHCDGGVPNLIVELDDKSARSLGRLIYFFEKSCAVSGYMLGVNPFDQPGVESYKKNMFALLGKPGYEELGSALRARLSQS